MDRTPLDPARLSPAAQKALGPGPARMMAARGLVPLPPGEQLAVLYQLSLERDQAIAVAARATATGLPEKLLGGALADAKLDPRVLDLFAELAGEKPVAFEALIGNAATADTTIATLAERGGAAEIDRIAANEQRLLRCPDIIAAMYLNKAARMSTVDRVVELAVRNKVRVPGLASWDDIARALAGPLPPPPPDLDEVFAAAVADDADDSILTTGNADEVIDEAENAAVIDAAHQRETPIEKLSVPAKLRLAVLGNGFQRSKLIRDPLKMVSAAAINSPAVTEFEAARYAGNSSLGEEVIRVIAGKREWTKLYGTKVALCRNPKTPMPDAMRLMPFLRDKDLVNMTKSKGISSAVVAQARKLLLQRRGGDKK